MIDYAGNWTIRPVPPLTPQPAPQPEPQPEADGQAEPQPEEPIYEEPAREPEVEPEPPPRPAYLRCVPPPGARRARGGPPPLGPNPAARGMDPLAPEFTPNLVRKTARIMAGMDRVTRPGGIATDEGLSAAVRAGMRHLAAQSPKPNRTSADRNLMTTTVTLGLVTLEAFEIPATIAFGGKQRLAVHDLPGGGRVIDVLGGTDTDITFAGIISGSDADTRAQLLDALRVSGATIPLSWGEQYFLVIISEADFDYRKPWWIPYRLRCVVQSNLVYAAASTAVSAAASITTKLATAAGLLSTPQPALAAAQAALAQTGATTYGTAAYGQSVTELTAAQSAVSGSVATTGSGLPSFDLGFTGQDPAAAAAAMTNTTTTAGSLAALTTAQGYLGSGLSTLQNLGT